MSAETTTVFELGEDSDTWLVAGTSDAHTADEAVRQWAEEHIGETIEAFTGAEDLVEFTFRFRKDWYWLPGGHPENPMDEAALVYPEDGQLLPGATPVLGPLAGFLVKA